ncbi:MucR family transcriptional regulator [Novosphingobium sp. 9U]|uniref:MucR family transcriptional regulator n=1 Tax=Novosphingobium sp. 9U TaxID=2653158 RepID=UPI0012F359B6|nr:MucR family transcriptional regulator [Novosphingobium sp. 9U]VWX50631.1 conserved hypothetical protein [Novosphingobium sp. 9U]
MSDVDTQPDVAALTVQLLSAYLSNNSVPSGDLADLIRSTRDALTGEGAAAVAEPEVHTPAVSVRKSLASPEHIISLIDGKPYKTLKRHLSSHGLTPADYRSRYGLPADYPMVALAYSDHRRTVAQRTGLGSKRPKPDAGAIDLALPDAEIAPPVVEEPSEGSKPKIKPQRAKTKSSAAAVQEAPTADLDAPLEDQPASGEPAPSQAAAAEENTGVAAAQDTQAPASGSAADAETSTSGTGASETKAPETKVEDKAGAKAPAKNSAAKNAKASAKGRKAPGNQKAEAAASEDVTSAAVSPDKGDEQKPKRRAKIGLFTKLSSSDAEQTADAASSAEVPPSEEASEETGSPLESAQAPAKRKRSPRMARPARSNQRPEETGEELPEA